MIGRDPELAADSADAAKIIPYLTRLRAMLYRYLIYLLYP
jgi:hypothetical protein